MMLEYVYLIFEIKIKGKIYLHFPEALFRGAFGNVLRKSCCVYIKRSDYGKDCNKCFLRNECMFWIMFGNDCNKNGGGGNAKTSIFNFIFNKEEIDGTYRLEMLIFGKLIYYIKEILLVFYKMSEEGIGKNRIKFSIENIYDSKELIFNKNEKIFKNPVIKEIKMDNFLFDGVEENNKKLIIIFKTPVRIQNNGKIIKDISFYDFIKSILIRLELLIKNYGVFDNSNYRPKSILELSKKVNVIMNDLRFERLKRYSDKQKKRMELFGYSGKIVFEGDVNKFENLIFFGKYLGVGKSTTFGFGRYDFYYE